MAQKQKFDPITLEILWRRLISIVDEADASVYRTSFSSLIRDAHDYTCAFFDADGREICEGTMVTPGQLGAMALGVKKICSLYPRENYKPGDVFITNDPWLLAGHLNDVCVMSPIFYKDKLVAFTSCVFHHTDVGGRQGADNHEVYEEGLFLPLVKLYDGGVTNEAMWDVIRWNVRKPEDVIGDIRSQVAANFVCSEKIVEMLEDVGLEDLNDLADEIIGRTENSVREAIAEVPDGVYPAEGVIEQIGGKDDVKIRLSVEVKGSDIIVDFAGSDPQVDWGINTVYNFTYAYVAFAIKSAFNPDIPNNEGSAAPLTVKAPEGSIVNCKFPVAVAHRTHVGHMLTEIIYRALSPATPKRILAGSGTTPGASSTMYGSRYNGDRFLSMTLRGGGMGASYAMDGHYCAQFPANVGNTPCEIFESDTPLIVEKKELIPDSGGPGKEKGGLGQEVVWKIPGDEYAPISPVVIATIMGRFRNAAQGLFGGKEGAKAKFQINGADKEWGVLEFCNPGDSVRYCHPGGGGYGDPLEREPELVESDVINGYVSLEKAKENYGVIIDPKTMKIDPEATKKLRGSVKRPK